MPWASNATFTLRLGKLNLGVQENLAEARNKFRPNPNGTASNVGNLVVQ